GADYLYLAPDGSYRITGVEHMGRFDIDHGTWRVDGPRLNLESAVRALDLVSYPFRVFVGPKRNTTLLPELKKKVLELGRRHGKGPVTPAEILKLKVQNGTGDDERLLYVSLYPDAEFGGRVVTVPDLIALAGAVDVFLAKPQAQGVFPYR